MQMTAYPLFYEAVFQACRPQTVRDIFINRQVGKQGIVLKDKADRPFPGLRGHSIINLSRKNTALLKSDS
jgi:hypothetical protein